MTKTKEVDVQNSPTHLAFASPKERRLHLRQKMDSGGGTESDRPDTAGLPAAAPVLPPGEKKKIHRAPSPARPKDVPGWSFTKIRGGIGTPTLSVKPGAIHLGSRISRRSPVGSLAPKDGKAERCGGKTAGKSSGGVSRTSVSKTAKSTGGRRKVSDASTGSDDLSKDSGCAPGKLSPTDSSSELSDCASEENKLSTDAMSSDAESRSSRGGGAEGEKPPREGWLADAANQRASAKSSSWSAEKDKDRLSLGMETAEGSASPGEERSVTSVDSRVPASTSLAFSDLTEELMDSMQEEFIREIEELRSENDYLKDEMEGLRSEMLEMRDMYMEEDVYQLQELRQQLEQANKTCRILQYRLRKVERRSLRVAQTGQVDGELIRTLEQDVKVAKDVSIRLHTQLDSVEKKRSRLDQENEELRVQLQELEVAKQVLQQEVDKLQNSQKKRGARPNNKPDKKPAPQEDSSDLKCQLHFAKEESALMCKKLTKLVKDSEAMKEELAKYRSLYGDINAPLTVEEVADSPHTREAEVRVHLKLVEEEANLLSRRIVELEVENRGLRAEMEDMKGPQDALHELAGAGGGLGSGLGLAGGVMVLGGSASSENVMELQRHLQFVEEEAELLRRSLMEMEEQNKLLMNEINRYKSELPTTAGSLTSGSLMSLTDGLLDSPVHSIQEGAVFISTETLTHEEELRLARLQIGELSGKVKKLQYENRVLLSNLQRFDLASYRSPSSSCSSPLRLALETDAEAGDSAECLPSSPTQRKEPLGGEKDTIEIEEQKRRMEDNADTTVQVPSYLSQKNHNALLAMRDQARLVSTAIQLLTSPESNCLSSSPSIYRKVCSNDAAEPCELEKPQPPSQIAELSDLADRPLVGALTSRLQALQSQLQAFVEQVDSQSRPASDIRDPQVEGASPPASPNPSVLCSEDDQDNRAEEKQPDYRDQPEPDEAGEVEESSRSVNKSENQESSQMEMEDKETDRAVLVCSCDVLDELSEAEESSCRIQEKLEKDRKDHKEIALKLSKLHEEQQKSLLRRDFQLQSLGLQARIQQKLWNQERTLLVQESQHLKQALLLLSLKLRCFLKQWRLGVQKDAEWKDVLEMNSLKDLYLLLQEDNLQSPTHNTDKRSFADDQPFSPTLNSSAVSSTLADLRVALQDLSGELRQERQGSQELTQQFAKAKASWEVERTELKSVITQLEAKSGKATVALCPSETLDASDLKVALKKEREEHQHLLAESYAAVMDLTKQLQIGERNWGREKLELLERFSLERAQWEQRLREATVLQEKPQPPGDESTMELITANGVGSKRSSILEQEGQEGTKTPTQEKFAVPLRLTRPQLGGTTEKHWTYLNTEMLDVTETCKTWDGPSGSSGSSQMDLEFVQRSYTAPVSSEIRIYYSPPAVRRLEHRQTHQEPHHSQNGTSLLGEIKKDASIASIDSLDGRPQQPASFFSSYEQWLSSLSSQHRELLESRSSCISSSLPSVINNSVSSGSPSRMVDGMMSSSAFHDLEIGDISANLSDDMKEMTNCVRQAIRSSSLERKSSKEPGSPSVSVCSRSTQTAAQNVSVGLQTDILTSSRTAGLHSKSWSPRASSTTTSSLASARTRQISTSLDKVHSRIDRPCCSPKYGSPKLQRRVSSGSTSRLDSNRDRSLWSLQQRPIGGGGGGSAWARSTTTRDSPVLSGLTDGLSSLFSVVEHSGSTESLWRGEIGTGPTASPARQLPAAGKPSGAAVVGSDPSSQRYGGLVQEFFRNVCSSRSSGGIPLSGEKVQKDSLSSPGGLGVLGGFEESKLECPLVGSGGLGSVAALGGSNDSVTRIVNKRFMRQTAGEEMVSIMGGGKELMNSAVAAGHGLEESPCDCTAQSACFSRPSRASGRHCKHRPQESPSTAEDRGDGCHE